MFIIQGFFNCQILGLVATVIYKKSNWFNINLDLKLRQKSGQAKLEKIFILDLACTVTGKIICFNIVNLFLHTPKVHFKTKINTIL